MKKNLSKTDIILFIKREKTFLKEKFGVVKIGLFGSYAKDGQSAESDIDILVELTEPRFDYLAGLQVYMENKLKKNIEIVRKSKLHQSKFIRQVEKNIIYV